VNLRRHWPFVAVVTALIAVPVAVVGFNEVRQATDRHVLLRAHPVDPHDLFRGEYVQLSYDISSLDPHARAGARVYVPLHRVGGYWDGDRVLDRPPTDGVFIRGRVGGEFGVRIRYGIESYFVEEGKARLYEEALSNGRLYADVALDDDGDAHLDRLVIRS
jgi:uncharacterized membrane-anchored protein